LVSGGSAGSPLPGQPELAEFPALLLSRPAPNA
jgi:hypothetical protein